MTGPLVSYCVPAYNVQDFIEQCIDSILDEGTERFEIIIVDDASSDDTAAIAETLAARDKRIKLVRHEYNMGLPSARNSAMQLARGEFLRHVDSDDLVTPGSTQRLLEVIAGADIARGNSMTFRNHTRNRYPMDWANQGIGNFSIEDIAASSFFRCNALGYVWLYLYRTEFLQSIGNPRFQDGLSILEDDIYNSEVLFKASRIAVTDTVVSLYRSGGMSSGKFWQFRQYMEQANALAVVAENIKHDPEFLASYLNGKANFVIMKTKVLRKAELSFEELCAYAEVIRGVYLEQNLEHYRQGSRQKPEGYRSYNSSDLHIMEYIVAGQLDTLYRELEY